MPIEYSEKNTTKQMIPKVSVIMPVYNAERFLTDTLESIQKQTFHDFELICVDDGSVDNSLTILKEFVDRDQRFHFIHQENSGAGVARNNGLRYANGDFLMFLDCDDLFEPELIEKLYASACSTDADVTVCRCNRFDDSTGSLTPCEWTIRKELLPENKVFNSLDVKSDFFDLFVWWPWDKIYKKQHIQKLGLQFQNLRTTNDLFFVCAATITASRISYIDDVLVHQRSGLKSSLSVTREKSWDCFYKALDKLKTFLIQQNLYNRFEQDFINYVANFSLWHLSTLHGYPYCLLYNSLKNEWLKQFDVVKHEASYFYNNDSYSTIQYILNHTVEEALLDKISGLQEQLVKTHKEIAREKENAAYWKQELNNVKNGYSFRTGRVITYVPRKVKGGIHCYKEHGGDYTVKRILWHLGLKKEWKE